MVTGANLAPTPALACVFDQVGSVAGTMINSTAIRCIAPRTLQQPTELRITLDGSLLSPDPLDFIFHDSRHAYATRSAEPVRPYRTLTPHLTSFPLRKVPTLLGHGGHPRCHAV